MKELLRIKAEFLSYDKEKVEMITQEDAKDCYIKYIDKLGYVLLLKYVSVFFTK